MLAGVVPFVSVTEDRCENAGWQVAGAGAQRGAGSVVVLELVDVLEVVELLVELVVSLLVELLVAVLATGSDVVLDVVVTLVVVVPPTIGVRSSARCRACGNDRYPVPTICPSSPMPRAVVEVSCHPEAGGMSVFRSRMPFSS